jgi:hypothetical protein
LVPSCPSCGKDLPGEFPFCPFCAAPLTATPPAAAAEERKVVSVLFCDLVGFTASSDAADPFTPRPGQPTLTASAVFVGSGAVLIALGLIS